MSSIDKVIERATNDIRPHPWRSMPFVADLKEDMTGRENPGGFATQAEFILELRVTSTYWANKAEKPEARKIALRVLHATLYEDALLHLHRLRSAVFSGTREEAIDACARLQSVIEGTP